MTQGNEDWDRVKALSELMIFAFVRALTAINHAEEMKADTEFFGIPLVITSFLEQSSELEEYGIEDEAVA
jgi:hypothetical protein